MSSGAASLNRLRRCALSAIRADWTCAPRLEVPERPGTPSRCLRPRAARARPARCAARVPAFGRLVGEPRSHTGEPEPEIAGASAAAITGAGIPRRVAASPCGWRCRYRRISSRSPGRRGGGLRSAARSGGPGRRSRSIRATRRLAHRSELRPLPCRDAFACVEAPDVTWRARWHPRARRGTQRRGAGEVEPRRAPGRPVTGPVRRRGQHERGDIRAQALSPHHDIVAARRRRPS